MPIYFGGNPSVIHAQNQNYEAEDLEGESPKFEFSLKPCSVVTTIPLVLFERGSFMVNQWEYNIQHVDI